MLLAVANGGKAAIRATGWRDLTAEQRAQVAPWVTPVATRDDLRPFTRAPQALPTQVTNYRHLPLIRSQSLENCGAFAPTYYLKTWQEARERDWVRPDPLVNPERVMSPGFTFPLSNGGVNAGAAPSLVLAILCRYGCATWRDMPENPTDWTSYPTEAVWRQAMPYRAERILSFDARTPAGQAAMKQHLADGNLLALSLLIYHDVYDNYPLGAGANNGVICAAGSVEWAPHTFTVIGYDDNKTYTNGGARSGAFLAVNSWGPNWGVSNALLGSAGCVWFAYDYLADTVGCRLLEVLGLVDRIGYQPTDVAVYTIEHPCRVELDVRIGAGPPAAPASPGWLEAFPDAGSTQSFAGTIAVDVTDFSAADPLAYWLRVEDALVDNPGWPAASGHVSRFYVERAGGLCLEADAVPLQTADDGIAYLAADPFVVSSDAFGGETGRMFMASAWADFSTGMGRPTWRCAGPTRPTPACGCSSAAARASPSTPLRRSRPWPAAPPWPGRTTTATDTPTLPCAATPPPGPSAGCTRTSAAAGWPTAASRCPP